MKTKGNSTKKAIIISCNDSYNYAIRTKYIVALLKNCGYDATIVSADFDHRTKARYLAKRENLVLLHVPPYKKNLSVKRIFSLIQFARKAGKYVSQIDPDIVYVSTPPNYLFKVFSKYRKRHDALLIGEIGDMWPESIPVGDRLKKNLQFPFAIWKRLRDSYIQNMDYVITECNYFRDILQKKQPDIRIRTIYFCKPKYAVLTEGTRFSENELNVCYLGSVNNIIDIESIGQFIQSMGRYRKVNFHMIGAGEQKALLLQIVRDAGARTVDHGTIFEDDEKYRILRQCHFAFNVMKNSVCVGMTMKSIDYLQFGIPLLNNISGDISQIVSQREIGFNMTKETIDAVVAQILSMTQSDYDAMRARTLTTFDELFSVECFEKQFYQVLYALGKGNDSGLTGSENR